LTAAAATVLVTLSAALADVLGASTGTVIVLLALAQTSAVAWLIVRSMDRERRWATAGVVLAGGWILTFLVPTWIYVLDPGLAAGLPVADGIRISTVALLSLVAGADLLSLVRPSRDHTSSQSACMQPVTLSHRWLIAWVTVGLAAMGLLFGLNGGPVKWITNLDKVGAMAEGLTYLIGVALVIKHAAVVALAHRLRERGRVDAQSIALAAAAVLILIPLGARLFIAVLLVEVLLLYALIVGPPRLRVLLPVGVLCTVVLIFGFGTVKRYQTFRAANPALDQGFVDYAKDRAIGETGAAYANNYADGIRLTAQARDLVPDRVGYEYGEAFARLALQPIPSPFRPEVAREPALERVLGERNGNAHAVPLQAEGYVQFGVPGVLIIFTLVGIGVGCLERAMRRNALALPGLITLVAIVVQVPFILRTGIPLGVAVAGLDVIGTYVVARTVLGATPGYLGEASEEEATNVATRPNGASTQGRLSESA
jgi:hypothetical protein